MFPFYFPLSSQIDLDPPGCLNSPANSPDIEILYEVQKSDAQNKLLTNSEDIYNEKKLTIILLANLEER